MANQALTVSEVNRRVKLMLEQGLPSVAVQGELSNVKLHTSGHLYFTLKDEYAQISGVMWRSRIASLGFVPQDGMTVVVSSRITVYEVRGVYQLDVSSMRQVGVGDLQAAFERLKEKLKAEGLFDLSRKKPLPQYPERIGLITSPTGAVIHDVLSGFRRRFPGLRVILQPVRVQGEGAAQEIARALQTFNEFGQVDVLILARGGGSLEDLWPFNEEVVARAIARSRIPVVSAVGHEVDVTIADFVADLRAPTPTAAAELVVRDRAALLDILRNSCYRMQGSVTSTLQHRRTHVGHLLKSYAFNRPFDLLHRYSQQVDELGRSLATAAFHGFTLTSARVRSLEERLRALSPALVLKRGYAIVRKEGAIVRSARSLQRHDDLTLEFDDGKIRSTVL
jgi:exodeoxyribonuclease VII large subunit